MPLLPLRPKRFQSRTDGDHASVIRRREARVGCRGCARCSVRAAPSSSRSRSVRHPDFRPTKRLDCRPRRSRSRRRSLDRLSIGRNVAQRVADYVRPVCSAQARIYIYIYIYCGLTNGCRWLDSTQDNPRVRDAEGCEDLPTWRHEAHAVDALDWPSTEWNVLRSSRGWPFRADDCKIELPSEVSILPIGSIDADLRLVWLLMWTCQ